MDYRNQFSDFMNECAEISGAITLRYFRRQIAVTDKDDRSPVTQADREIETALRDLIQQRFPTHGIIGEEFGKHNETADFVWVIDPIDGTRAFMTGKPLFGTLIGLMHHGRPVAGMMDQPFIKERWLGFEGSPTTYNGRPVTVPPPRKLNEARLYIGSPDMFAGDRYEASRKVAQVSKWPQYGCDCYAYGLLSMNCCDIVMEQNLKIWDAVALAPIVTGAGGFITDWELNPVSFDFSGTLVAASSRALAEEALRFFT